MHSDAPSCIVLQEKHYAQLKLDYFNAHAAAAKDIHTLVDDSREAALGELLDDIHAMLRAVLQQS